MNSAPLARIALDFVDEVTSVAGVTTAQDLLLEHTRGLGFDHLIVCDLPVPGQSFEAHLCNWPAAFFQHFCRSLVNHAPIMKHASRTTEPFVWSEVQWDRSRGSPEQRVMDEAAAAGLEDGFVVPVVGVKGDQSCLGLSGRPATLEDPDKRALHLMCLYAHHAARKRRTARARGESGNHSLSALQRDCLQYAFMGHNADAISERLPLSAGEVRSLSRRAANALGVFHPLEAAVRAAVLGEIRP